MIKVSIPAYKMRGESAFLECQYELNRTHGPQMISEGHRERDRQHSHGGGDAHYVDVDSERQPYRRMYQNQRQHSQHRKQHQPMAMRQYQSQTDSQSPQLPQKSPYGHSVYRGSAASGYLGGRVGASIHNGGGGGGSIGGGGGSGSSSSGSVAYIPDFDHEDRYAESEEEERPQEEGEALYAIKWYKDNEEFYRYVPKSRPPKTSYRVDGVRVIVSSGWLPFQWPVGVMITHSLSLLCLLCFRRRSCPMRVACYFGV